MIVRPDSANAAPQQGAQDTPAQPTVPVRVEVSPGQVSEMQLPREAIGRYGILKWVLRQDGTVLPVLRSWSAMARITKDLPRMLGLDISVHTLHVLVRSGLVRGAKLAPSTTLIDVDSLVRHIQQTTGEKAREYWTAERHQSYQDAYTNYHQRCDGMTTRQPHARKEPAADPESPPLPPAAPAPKPAARPARPVDSTPDLFDFPVP